MISDRGANQGADPSLIAVAQRLAKDVLDCDPSILSLIVVDDLGRILNVSRSERLKESERVGAEQVQTFGTIAKMIIGAAAKAAPEMGGTEAIIGVFKRQKVLLINLQEYKVLLALRLTRSSNAEYVCDKIGEMLATRGEK